MGGGRYSKGGGASKDPYNIFTNNTNAVGCNV
jgi:hypothetical protein